MDTNRTARLEAYNRFRAIVEELRGIKLHQPEADELIWAAEGLLLATSAQDADAVTSQTAFDTLLADLAQHRWADLAPTALRLRQAFAECAPQPARALA